MKVKLAALGRVAQ